MPNKTAVDREAARVQAGTKTATTYTVTSTTLGYGEIKELIRIAEAGGGHVQLVAGKLTLFYAPT